MFFGEVRVRLPQSFQALVQQIRHAGGGGRPGGKPTLNWRQKQQLRLTTKENKTKLRTFGGGNLSEIEHLLGKDWMKKAVDLSKVTEFKSPVINVGDRDGENNSRKQIQSASLFGSNKPFGLLEAKPSRRPFSHKRLASKRQQSKNA